MTEGGITLTPTLSQGGEFCVTAKCVVHPPQSPPSQSSPIKGEEVNRRFFKGYAKVSRVGEGEDREGNPAHPPPSRRPLLSQG